MRLRSLLLKEFIQFSRDRVMLILILWLYTVEVVICAYALTFDVERLPFAAVDLDRSAASGELLAQFQASTAFEFAAWPPSAAAAAELLDAGTVRAALVVPQHFGSELHRGTAPSLQLLLDGSDSNTAAIARGYVLQVLDRFQQDWTPGAGGTAARVRPVVRVWYNPAQTFTAFMVLSMIALAALMVGVIHPAAAIVREKEVGTLEQLLVTPIRTGELFLAKTAPTLAIGLLSVFPSLLIVWWFGVPLRGSLGLFLALTALFLLSAIGLGVLVAAVTGTLQQALLLSFFGLFPLMFLSGTLVPVESMPPIIQYLSLLSPLRHYMDVILGVFLKGTGLVELWPQTLALGAIGSTLYGLGLGAFQRHMG